MDDDDDLLLIGNLDWMRDKSTAMGNRDHDAVEDPGVPFEVASTVEKEAEGSILTLASDSQDASKPDRHAEYSSLHQWDFLNPAPEETGNQVEEASTGRRTSRAKRPTMDPNCEMSPSPDVDIYKSDEGCPDEGLQSVSPQKRKKGKRQPADPAARELEREERRLKAAEDKQRKVAEREAAREARLAAKEAERQAKKNEREAALRLKGSGKRAEEDMRVLLDRRVPLHPCCKDVISTLARESLNAAISPGDHPLAPRASLLWQRAVPSRDGLCESLQDIPYVLVILSGEQFVAEVDDGHLQALLNASANAHPGYTLSLLLVGLDHYLTTRERRDFRREVSVSAGAFIRQRYDQAVASLAVQWPGVRHHLVPDAAAAAERIVQLTKALAQQPHKGTASFLESFGGPKRDTISAKQLLVQCPIQDPKRQTTFYALSYVPDVGPPIAHTLADRFPSLAALTTYFLDPTRSQADKEKELANLPRALGGARLGPSAIRRLCALLTTDDPFASVKSLNSRD
eukprot:jgi/Botrbrau1/1247/Bobra.0163s0040.1